jgi:hypothetical protein
VVHPSDETRRAASAAGRSPADRDAPPGGPHEDEHDGEDEEDDAEDLVSAVEDLVNDLVPTGDEAGGRHR